MPFGPHKTCLPEGLITMKTDIVTLAIVVFCVGVLISALDLGDVFSPENNDVVVALESR